MGNSNKIRIIDLFSGCGGLTEGFMKTNKYQEVAAVEWLKPQVETLRARLKSKWKKVASDEFVMHFDIQREDELFSGWDNDEKFASGKGLDYFVEKSKGVDVIVGGPPCQAYSIAGRVRDEDGMKNDYRNYLFEHYLSIVKKYQPKLFVFENVPGILSARPGETPITKLISDSFNEIGYVICDDLGKYAVINASDYGVPQNRKRVIILGVKKGVTDFPQEIIKKFYTKQLPKYSSSKKVSVKDSIGDLPPCIPIVDPLNQIMRISHETPECLVSRHTPRYANKRDIETFRMLAEDLASGKCEYNSKKISELYEKKIGSRSPIHRYHVLRPDVPSTTIIAHLKKDGHRYIHYDPTQARTITIREAARLQSFDDDFQFLGAQGDAYQMIGNAVPPKLAKSIAMALSDLFYTLK